jgi:hypothetical protein
MSQLLPRHVGIPSAMMWIRSMRSSSCSGDIRGCCCCCQSHTTFYLVRRCSLRSHTSTCATTNSGHRMHAYRTRPMSPEATTPAMCCSSFLRRQCASMHGGCLDKGMHCLTGLTTTTQVWHTAFTSDHLALLGNILVLAPTQPMESLQ